MDLDRDPAFGPGALVRGVRSQGDGLLGRVRRDDIGPRPRDALLLPQPGPALTTYRCELRDGLTFSNGNPLTATAVKHSFERILRGGEFTGLGRVGLRGGRPRFEGEQVLVNVGEDRPGAGVVHPGGVQSRQNTGRPDGDGLFVRGIGGGNLVTERAHFLSVGVNHGYGVVRTDRPPAVCVAAGRRRRARGSPATRRTSGGRMRVERGRDGPWGAGIRTGRARDTYR
ncbi:ABC transporter substrate-binding protein [Streptomyces globisporus]|uniref:ABC transporter substrate-binding protein n=1 Tax=Streptomyces globisporus TaxID=1908 RepID=UPI0036968E28